MTLRTAIGIDIGGTNLRAARVGADGAIQDIRSERISRDPRQAVERALALALLLDAPDVAAIGVGVPGRVDSAASRMLSGGFLDLAGWDPAGHLRERLGRPVLLDSDCNMALVAELRAGAAKGRRHVVMLTIGTGIGGAVALDGAILRGRASGGQLGHITVQHGGLPCACGRRGCIETTSSGTALGRLIAEAGLPVDTRIETLLASRHADPVAENLIRAWASPLRDTIDSIVATVDPELILLGGGLGKAACLALASIPARSPWYQCPVEPAALGDDAGVTGSALAALSEAR